jgi:hypothetical protein
MVIIPGVIVGLVTGLVGIIWMIVRESHNPILAQRRLCRQASATELGQDSRLRYPGSPTGWLQSWEASCPLIYPAVVREDL